MDEFTEILILDDDAIDGEDYRNATRDYRSGRRPPSRPGARSARGGRRAIIRRPTSHTSVRGGNNPIVRRDTGGLSTGMMVEAGAQVLAAIQSLPLPPVATGKVEKDIANMVLYQAALAEHAKRDEQLRTIGSLASKLFA